MVDGRPGSGHAVVSKQQEVCTTIVEQVTGMCINEKGTPTWSTSVLWSVAQQSFIAV